MTFCFRYIPVLTLCFLSANAPAADEDLFSEVKPATAFSSGDPQSPGDTRSTLTTAEEVREMLKKAGFEAKIAGSLAASTEKQIDRWTIPVLVSVSEDENWLQIALGLKVIEDPAKQLSATDLLALMKASQDHAPACFCFRPDRKRTEVALTLRNQNLSPALLRSEINRLAIAAKNTSSLWADEPQTVTKTPTQKPSKSPTSPEINSPPPGTSLTGQWVASRSATEAFAIEFQPGQKFKLVYINAGQQTKSNGSFSLANSSLILTAQNLKLEGSLSVKSATTFEFTPRNQSALVFSKAK